MISCRVIQKARKFPLWLSPMQVKILLISDKDIDYAKEIEMLLKREGLRCEVDGRSENIALSVPAWISISG